MITVQFVKLEDFVAEVEANKARVDAVRLAHWQSGNPSPGGERMYMTEAGAIVGDRLYKLMLINPATPGSASADMNGAKVREAIEALDIDVLPGRFE